MENDTDYPYRVQCEQFKLTRIIVSELDKMDNVEVLFDVKGTGASQDEDGVSLFVETPDGPRTLLGKYLIAADGASSAIRVSQGIDFPGLTFPELWLCTSSEFNFEDHFENLAPIAYVADPDFLVRICSCSGDVAAPSSFPSGRDGRNAGF